MPIEWVDVSAASDIDVHVVVFVRRYRTLIVDGSSVAHVTVAPARVVDAVTALITGAVRSWGGVMSTLPYGTAPLETAPRPAALRHAQSRRLSRGEHSGTPHCSAR